MTQHPHIVIVGAGFGGLRAARALKHGDVRITVIDRRNYHLFQPWLYEVATAGLSPNDIAYPIRAVLRRQKNSRVFLAEVVAIDTKRRKVVLQDGEVEYDYLILATGAGHSYFGHPEWEAYAPGLKTIEDALEIRRRILLAFEMAERETDEERRRALLTYVIIGGGPTGVELAGAIAEIAYTGMVQDFRSIRPQDARIILVEAGPPNLPVHPGTRLLQAETALKRLGVEIVKDSPVTSVHQGMVMAGTQTIHAGTIVWAAGVEPSPLARSLGVPRGDVGREPAHPHPSISGHPEVFVIGDLAALVADTVHLRPRLAAA